MKPRGVKHIYKNIYVEDMDIFIFICQGYLYLLPRRVPVSMGTCGTAVYHNVCASSLDSPRLMPPGDNHHLGAWSHL